MSYFATSTPHRAPRNGRLASTEQGIRLISQCLIAAFYAFLVHLTKPENGIQAASASRGALFLSLGICVVVLAIAFRSPMLPLYCYCFVAPTYLGFGTGLVLIVAASISTFILQEHIPFAKAYSAQGLLLMLWGASSLLWVSEINVTPEGFLCATLPGMALSYVVARLCSRGAIARRAVLLCVTIAVVVGAAASYLNWQSGEMYLGINSG